MIVSAWMTPNIITIAPDATIAEAAALMAKRRVRRLLVVNPKANDAHLLGIVSATDILHAFPPDVNPFAIEPRHSPDEFLAVHQIMKGNPLTVRPDTPIEEAAHLMRIHKIGALPVVRDAKLVGVITESDIFRAFASLFASPEAGVRITFYLDQKEDAFSLIAGLTAGHAVHVLSLFTSVQADSPVCVVQLTGKGMEAFLEAMWKSKHRVLNVLHIASHD